MRIFQLGAIPKEHSVGGKARGLDLLVSEGQSVPPGISLSFTSYESFSALKDELESSSDGPLLNEIVKSLKDLGSDLILRSSAPLEDGQHQSFAGIFLSIRCPLQNERIRSGLLKCMMALNSAQAQAYQVKNSVLHFVIQKFVQAQFSGVLFVNPDGSAQVEVVWGECEQLVSGKVTPFTMTYRDGNLSLVRTGDNPGNIVTRNWHTIHRKILELIHIALSSKTFLGTDIEWLVDEQGLIWLLQRRPITQTLPLVQNNIVSLSSRIGSKPAQVTNVNLKENYPKAVKPFILSIASNSYRHYFGHFAKSLHVPFNQKTESLFASSVCHIDGFIFYNMSAIEELIHYLPIGPFIKNYFHQFIGYTPAKSNAVLSNSISLNELWLFLKFIMRSGISIYKSRKQVHRFGEDVRIYIDQANKAQISLSDQLIGFLNFRFEKWGPLAISDYSALLSFGALNSFLKKFANSFYKKNQISFLLLAIDDLISTQNSVALNKVVLEISKNDRIKMAWTSLSSSEILYLLDNDSQYSSIKILFHQYQMDWGFRFSQELTLDEANYLENPRMLVDLIRVLLLTQQNYNQEQKSINFKESYQVHFQDALTQIRECGIVGKVFGRFMFQFLIDWTRNSLRFRELSRTHQARLYAQLRQTLLLLGDQFCQQGIIISREDVLYLTYQEVQAILQRQFAFPKSLPEQIATRKYFHSQALKLPPPQSQTAFLDDQLLYQRDENFLTETSDEPMSGLVACAGTIEGRAVVITDLNEINLVKNGDILITQQTDPGWSPIFPLIQGLVVEHGGILSHGAILAREFGIPCIIGVPAVTRKIQTGDRVRIDGELGLITFL